MSHPPCRFPRRLHHPAYSYYPCSHPATLDVPSWLQTTRALLLRLLLPNPWARTCGTVPTPQQAPFVRNANSLSTPPLLNAAPLAGRWFRPVVLRVPGAGNGPRVIPGSSRAIFKPRDLTCLHRIPARGSGAYKVSGQSHLPQQQRSLLSSPRHETRLLPLVCISFLLQYALSASRYTHCTLLSTLTISTVFALVASPSFRSHTYIPPSARVSTSGSSNTQIFSSKNNRVGFSAFFTHKGEMRCPCTRLAFGFPNPAPAHLTCASCASLGLANATPDSAPRSTWR